MTPPRVETSPSDEKLREHLLTDGQLSLFETKHAGQVRVLSVGRYRARLSAGEFVLEFMLRKWDGDHRTFTVSLAQQRQAHEVPSELYQLAYHRAAEAMLALRRGHMEHRLNRREKAQTG